MRIAETSQWKGAAVALLFLKHGTQAMMAKLRDCHLLAHALLIYLLILSAYECVSYKRSLMHGMLICDFPKPQGLPALL